MSSSEVCNDNHKVYDEEWIIDRFENSLMSDKFQIFLHPQVDMSGKILGAEVLTRWFDTENSMVPVSKFIPILAKSDLISKMDEHIWELAARQLSYWKDTELRDLHLSVNVEPKDFCFIKVPEKIRALCERYKISTNKLHVEITERGFTSDLDAPEDILLELHKNGITVEIDDFGNGSSSLALLSNLDVDVLKLDMGFVRNTKNSSRSKIILESIVDMAEKLETELIVEGVETIDQKNRIQTIGCKVYQGFLFSQPVPVPEFEKLYYESIKQHQ